MATSEDRDILNLALRLMENDEQLTADDIERLSNDAEVMRVFSELQNCKNAIIRKSDPNIPDADREWRRFSRRVDYMSPDTDTTPESPATQSGPRILKLRWQRVWKVSAGIAASLLIALAAWKFIPNGEAETDGILAFAATEDVDYVTLSTGKGNTIDLSTEIDPSSLHDKQANIQKADVDELAYISSEMITTFDTHLVRTPRGKDYKITLEDGTIVWLNAESSLQYPSRFTGTTRQVHLKGEAYFQVAKNPDRPFIITTDRMDVRVLGTELNIKNYAEHDSHVILINGSVQVSDRHDKNHSATLVPGQDARWIEGQPFAVNDVDTDVYVYWKDGYFYFDNKPLVDVMEELGRWYNFNVVFENKDVMNTEVRFFCLRSQSAERAVELLNNMKKIYATLSDNTVRIK